MLPRNQNRRQTRQLREPNTPPWSVLTGFDLLKEEKPGKGAVDRLQQSDTQEAEKTEDKDMLRCAACHAVITRRSDRIQINEKHQHVFANPYGYIFNIGCFARAPGCVVTGEETRYFSWFPGFAWQIALCGQCLALLGWAFRSQESNFFGLILDNLV